MVPGIMTRPRALKSLHQVYSRQVTPKKCPMKAVCRLHQPTTMWTRKEVGLERSWFLDMNVVVHWYVFAKLLNYIFLCLSSFSRGIVSRGNPCKPNFLEFGLFLIGQLGFLPLHLQIVLRRQYFKIIHNATKHVRYENLHTSISNNNAPHTWQRCFITHRPRDLFSGHS